MHFSWSSRLLLFGALVVAEATDKPQVKNVAIIGAGAAGSSVAYHLQQYAEQEGISVNITLFEKSHRIGGRTLTVEAYDDPSQPIELGASIFVTVNHILHDATSEFDLPVHEPHQLDKGDITAIWNGHEFVYQSAEGTGWWWDVAKLWWKYGLAPYKAVKLVKSTVDTFLKLYEPPYFPYRSLTQRAYELGLEKITGITGEQFLAENNIHPLFGNDIIQTATRVNYASNLAFIHGLETMVSFATDGALAVDGGNWQIFERMVRHSGASLYRNTSVTSITVDEKKDKTSKYHVSIKEANSKTDSSEDYELGFDNVVIASPWQYSNIKAGDGVLQHTIDKIPYMKLHVTLFTSPLKLHGEFFGLEPGSKAPSNVYTTLAQDDVPQEGPKGVGSAGFYSISTLKTVVNPKTGQREFAYKIFSPDRVTPEFLSKLLGTKIPENFIDDRKSGDEATFEPISWYYPHWFYAYPIELPRVTFQDPIIGRGLYYTSGIESFISCMETSALSGKNVARLIADDFAGISREDQKQEDTPLRVQGAGEL